ncbi:hypothetical protein PHJA_000561100 [Phtheirospermum japonicum]|uniref:HNH nuclease domain-containing protein n=1 Tax=Phtheirospermum japonicum TaxID=374723 RepID=A0A830BHE3_9LAMI|nr:hypothetical protein PHJA_000561100 [Phtheirospermum japonicum]
MAQFTSGGRLKSLFGCDGLSSKANAFGSRFTYSSSIPLGNRKCNICILGASSSARNLNNNNNTNNPDGVFDEILKIGDPDFEIDELASFRGLVLDISYRPRLIYVEFYEIADNFQCNEFSVMLVRPVNVVCWKRAICLEFMDKADVLEYYDQTVNSPSGSFYIPAVLRVPHLLQVVKRRKVKRGLSRKNILQRDNFTCQYCSSSENLTIDHIIPIAQGGKWTWENLVTACAKCNSRKGQKTLEEVNMKLMKVPKAPKDYDILAIPLTNQAIKMLKTRKGMPEEWQQYLSKPYAAP